jgi:hypothetical protein
VRQGLSPKYRQRQKAAMFGLIATEGIPPLLLEEAHKRSQWQSEANQLPHCQEKR